MGLGYIFITSFHTPSNNVRAIDNNYAHALLQFYVHSVDVQPYMTCMEMIILLIFYRPMTPYCVMGRILPYDQ